MRNISKILGLLLLLPLFTGCNDSDDVAAIFTGKTWKLNYITVDGGHDMFPFWENEAQKTKIYDELNKNGTYNVIFEGTVEGDIIKGNIKGTVITTTGNFEGTWSANGKNNKFRKQLRRHFPKLLIRSFLRRTISGLNKKSVTGRQIEKSG